MASPRLCWLLGILTDYMIFVHVTAVACKNKRCGVTLKTMCFVICFSWFCLSGAIQSWTWTYCRWGKRRGRPGLCCVSRPTAQTCSARVLTARRQIVLHTERWTKLKTLVVVATLCSSVCVYDSPTIELHGHLPPLLVVHDCIWVIVCLSDHNLGVLLRTSSYTTGSVSGRTDSFPQLVNIIHHWPFSVILPGVVDKV